MSAGNCPATYVAPTLTWNIGLQPTGTFSHCYVTATVTAGGSIQNSATISSPNVIDPLPENDTGIVTINNQQSVIEIPTLSGLGFAALALLLGGAGLVRLRRPAS